MAPANTVHFPPEYHEFLEPHLPPVTTKTPEHPQKIFTTLTYAISLDAQLALSPGAQTILSGPESKAMTHYLRSRHDAILIGVGTAVADNPSLNCRLEGVGGYGGEGLDGQPRPVVVDPIARWGSSSKSKIFQLVREGRGRAPWIVTRKGGADGGKRDVLEGLGGKFIEVESTTTGSGERRLEWKNILEALRDEGMRSVLIEGGGSVINDLLLPSNIPLVDSVIITIAPTWLGTGGVVVSPERRHDEVGAPMTAARLQGVKWYPLGEDVVLCGKVKA